MKTYEPTSWFERNSRRIARFLCFWFPLSQIFLSGQAWAGSLIFPKEPLASSLASVKPNILFVLDDSSSMGYDYLPDFVRAPTELNPGSHTAKFGSCFSAGANIDSNPKDCGIGDPPHMSSQFNRIYYDPSISYTPPPLKKVYEADGVTPAVDVNNNPVFVTYPSQTNWTAVQTDPFGRQKQDQLEASRDTINLLTEYPDHAWCRSPADPSHNITCKTNTAATGYYYPDDIYKYGQDYNSNRIVATGAPYYYQLSATVYCKNPELKNYSYAAGSTVPVFDQCVNNASGPSGDYKYPAPVQWCEYDPASSKVDYSVVQNMYTASDTVRCQGKRIGNFAYPRHLGYVAPGAVVKSAYWRYDVASNLAPNQTLSQFLVGDHPVPLAPAQPTGAAPDILNAPITVISGDDEVKIATKIASAINLKTSVHTGVVVSPGGTVPAAGWDFIACAGPTQSGVGCAQSPFDSYIVGPTQVAANTVYIFPTKYTGVAPLPFGDSSEQPYTIVNDGSAVYPTFDDLYAKGQLPSATFTIPVNSDYDVAMGVYEMRVNDIPLITQGSTTGNGSALNAPFFSSPSGLTTLNLAQGFVGATTSTPGSLCKALNDHTGGLFSVSCNVSGSNADVTITGLNPGPSFNFDPAKTYLNLVKITYANSFSTTITPPVVASATPPQDYVINHINVALNDTSGSTAAGNIKNAVKGHPVYFTSGQDAETVANAIKASVLASNSGVIGAVVEGAGASAVVKLFSNNAAPVTVTPLNNASSATATYYPRDCSYTVPAAVPYYTTAALDNITISRVQDLASNDNLVDPSAISANAVPAPVTFPASSAATAVAGVMVAGGSIGNGFTAFQPDVTNYPTLVKIRNSAGYGLTSCGNATWKTGGSNTDLLNVYGTVTTNAISSTVPAYLTGLWADNHNLMVPSGSATGAPGNTAMNFRDAIFTQANGNNSTGYNVVKDGADGTKLYVYHSGDDIGNPMTGVVSPAFQADLYSSWVSITPVAAPSDTNAVVNAPAFIIGGGTNGIYATRSTGTQDYLLTSTLQIPSNLVNLPRSISATAADIGAAINAGPLSAVYHANVIGNTVYLYNNNSPTPYSLSSVTVPLVSAYDTILAPAVQSGGPAKITSVKDSAAGSVLASNILLNANTADTAVATAIANAVNASHVTSTYARAPGNTVYMWRDSPTSTAQTILGAPVVAFEASFGQITARPTVDTPAYIKQFTINGSVTSTPTTPPIILGGNNSTSTAITNAAAIAAAMPAGPPSYAVSPSDTTKVNVTNQGYTFSSVAASVYDDYAIFPITNGTSSLYGAQITAVTVTMSDNSTVNLIGSNINLDPGKTAAQVATAISSAITSNSGTTHFTSFVNGTSVYAYYVPNGGPPPTTYKNLHASTLPTITANATYGKIVSSDVSVNARATIQSITVGGVNLFNPATPINLEAGTLASAVSDAIVSSVGSTNSGSPWTAGYNSFFAKKDSSNTTDVYVWKFGTAIAANPVPTITGSYVDLNFTSSPEVHGYVPAYINSVLVTASPVDTSNILNTPLTEAVSSAPATVAGHVAGQITSYKAINSGTHVYISKYGANVTDANLGAGSTGSATKTYGKFQYGSITPSAVTVSDATISSITVTSTATTDNGATGTTTNLQEILGVTMPTDTVAHPGGVYSAAGAGTSAATIALELKNQINAGTSAGLNHGFTAVLNGPDGTGTTIFLYKANTNITAINYTTNATYARLDVPAAYDPVTPVPARVRSIIVSGAPVGAKQVLDNANIVAGTSTFTEFSAGTTGATVASTIAAEINKHYGGQPFNASSSGRSVYIFNGAISITTPPTVVLDNTYAHVQTTDNADRGYSQITSLKFGGVEALSGAVNINPGEGRNSIASKILAALQAPFLGVLKNGNDVYVYQQWATTGAPVPTFIANYGTLSFAAMSGYTVPAYLKTITVTRSAPSAGTDTIYDAGAGNGIMIDPGTAGLTPAQIASTVMTGLGATSDAFGVGVSATLGGYRVYLPTGGSTIYISKLGTTITSVAGTVKSDVQQIVIARPDNKVPFRISGITVGAGGTQLMTSGAVDYTAANTAAQVAADVAAKINAGSSGYKAIVNGASGTTVYVYHPTLAMSTALVPSIQAQYGKLVVPNPGVSSTVPAYVYSIASTGTDSAGAASNQSNVLAPASTPLQIAAGRTESQAASDIQGATWISGYGANVSTNEVYVYAPGINITGLTPTINSSYGKFTVARPDNVAPARVMTVQAGGITLNYLATTYIDIAAADTASTAAGSIATKIHNDHRSAGAFGIYDAVANGADVYVFTRTVASSSPPSAVVNAGNALTIDLRANYGTIVVNAISASNAVSDTVPARVTAVNPNAGTDNLMGTGLQLPVLRSTSAAASDISAQISTVNTANSWTYGSSSSGNTVRVWQPGTNISFAGGTVTVADKYAYLNFGQAVDSYVPAQVYSIQVTHDGITREALQNTSIPLAHTPVNLVAGRSASNIASDLATQINTTNGNPYSTYARNVSNYLYLYHPGAAAMSVAAPTVYGQYATLTASNVNTYVPAYVLGMTVNSNPLNWASTLTLNNGWTGTQVATALAGRYPATDAATSTLTYNAATNGNSLYLYQVGGNVTQASMNLHAGFGYVDVTAPVGTAPDYLTSVKVTGDAVLSGELLINPAPPIYLAPATSANSVAATMTTATTIIPSGTSSDYWTVNPSSSSRVYFYNPSKQTISSISALKSSKLAALLVPPSVGSQAPGYITNVTVNDGSAHSIALTPGSGDFAAGTASTSLASLIQSSIQADLGGYNAVLAASNTQVQVSKANVDISASITYQQPFATLTASATGSLPVYVSSILVGTANSGAGVLSAPIVIPANKTAPEVAAILQPLVGNGYTAVLSGSSLYIYASATTNPPVAIAPVSVTANSVTSNSLSLGTWAGGSATLSGLRIAGTENEAVDYSVTAPDPTAMAAAIATKVNSSATMGTATTKTWATSSGGTVTVYNATLSSPIITVPPTITYPAPLHASTSFSIGPGEGGFSSSSITGLYILSGGICTSPTSANLLYQPSDSTTSPVALANNTVDRDSTTDLFAVTSSSNVVTVAEVGSDPMVNYSYAKLNECTLGVTTTSVNPSSKPIFSSPITFGGGAGMLTPVGTVVASGGSAALSGAIVDSTVNATSGSALAAGLALSATTNQNSVTIPTSGTFTSSLPSSTITSASNQRSTVDWTLGTTATATVNAPTYANSLGTVTATGAIATATATASAGTASLANPTPGMNSPNPSYAFATVTDPTGISLDLVPTYNTSSSFTIGYGYSLLNYTHTPATALTVTGSYAAPGYAYGTTSRNRSMGDLTGAVCYSIGASVTACPAIGSFTTGTGTAMNPLTVGSGSSTSISTSLYTRGATPYVINKAALPGAGTFGLGRIGTWPSIASTTSVSVTPTIQGSLLVNQIAKFTPPSTGASYVRHNVGSFYRVDIVNRCPVAKPSCYGENDPLNSNLPYTGVYFGQDPATATVANPNGEVYPDRTQDCISYRSNAGDPNSVKPGWQKGCTYDEEMTNFANWYAYYRTRMQMMKSASGSAFNFMDDGFRIGFMTIHPNSGQYVTVSDFNILQKDLWYKMLYGIPVPTNSETPLRAALSTAGRIYAGQAHTDPISGIVDDPVQYSCQQNFTILTTDGYWFEGDESKVVGIDGSTKIVNQDHTPAASGSEDPYYDGDRPASVTATAFSCPMGKQANGVTDVVGCYGTTTPPTTRPDCADPNHCDPFSGADPAVINYYSTSTLADVAFYYYFTDLRSSSLHNCTGGLGTGYDVCSDDVFDTAKDPQRSQHMTTFTLGLGVDGVLSYKDSKYESDKQDDPNVTGANRMGDYRKIVKNLAAWPQVRFNDMTGADDLWHAAVNGHGLYFSARNPTTLTAGLREALASIQQSSLGSAGATSNLTPERGDNFAFTASYTTKQWFGNVRSYEIDLGSGAVSYGAIWCVADVAGSTEIVGSTTITIPPCSGKLLSQVGNRNIYLLSNDTTTYPNKLRPFAWANLSATEKGYFDITALNQYSGLPTAAKADPVSGAQYMVDYIKGSSTHDGRPSNFPPGGVDARMFRTRDNIMGDVVGSQPAYVKAPRFSYDDPGYFTFKKNNLNRAPTLYVGANDGMLHAFDATTVGTTGNNAITNPPDATAGGKERWAFIPGQVTRKLWRLAEDTAGTFDGQYYASHHQYYVNGTPNVADVCVQDCDNEANAVWKTILVVGLKEGGRGYFALDVTDPTQPKGLWELHPNSSPYSDADIGYAFGTPIIAKYCYDGASADGCTDIRWGVMVTSGYNNSPASDPAESPPGTNTKLAGPGDGKGYLYVLDPMTGQVIRKITTGQGDSGNPSGLSKMHAYVENPTLNAYTRYIYAGDLNGWLYRFDLQTNPVDGSGANGAREMSVIAKLTGPTSAAQPITTAPLITTYKGKRLVLVGTGRYIDSSDPSSTAVQSVYGIFDKDAWRVDQTDAITSPHANGSGLVMQTLSANEFVEDATTHIRTYLNTRTMSSNPVDPGADKGWYFDLGASIANTTENFLRNDGERVVADPVLSNSILTIPTSVPRSNSYCSPGGFSWTLKVDYRTGGALSTSTGGKSGYAFTVGGMITGLNILLLDSGIATAASTTKHDRLEVDPAKDGYGSNSVVTGRRSSWRELVD